MRISAALPAGVTALLFDQVKRRRRFEGLAVEILEERGFSEAILPILDYFEPYQALVTRQLRDELYRFVDRDGELLVLRGDFTPMLARLLAPCLESLELPLRLFYRGDLVRYQEERPGRLREYYEIGAELLGVAGQEPEEEVLDLFLRILSLEGEEIRVILGFAGALDGLLLAADVDDRSELARAVARRERRVASAASTALLEVVEEGVPVRANDLGSLSATRLEALQDLCARLQTRFDPQKVTLAVDLAEFAEDFVDGDLVRDAERRPYYDGLVFRAYLGGSAQSIGRGGRYDRLFRRLGCDLSAVGFSISVDPMLRGAGS